jgi:hypothetical protein
MRNVTWRRLFSFSSMTLKASGCAQHFLSNRRSQRTQRQSVMSENNGPLCNTVDENLKTLLFKFPVISFHLPNYSSIFCLFSGMYLVHYYAYPQNKPPNSASKCSPFSCFSLLRFRAHSPIGRHCLCNSPSVDR